MIFNVSRQNNSQDRNSKQNNAYNSTDKITSIFLPSAKCKSITTPSVINSPAMQHTQKARIFFITNNAVGISVRLLNGLIFSIIVSLFCSSLQITNTVQYRVQCKIKTFILRYGISISSVALNRSKSL